MKLWALLTPVIMLGALWVLQRLEVWMSHPLGQDDRGSSRRVSPRHTLKGSSPRRRREVDRA